MPPSGAKAGKTTASARRQSRGYESPAMVAVVLSRAKSLLPTPDEAISLPRVGDDGHDVVEVRASGVQRTVVERSNNFHKLDGNRKHQGEVKQAILEGCSAGMASRHLNGCRRPWPATWSMHVWF